MRFAGIRRTMRPRLGSLLTTLVLLSVSGCGGDDPTGVVATAADVLELGILRL
jgi:hypothetical protein